MQFPKSTYKRRKPKQKDRAAITKKQYNLALDWFGDTCSICNGAPIEMHHVVFRSQQGRGGFRNLMPLCEYHHKLAHRDRGFADELRDMRFEAFGKLYYTDAYDLHDIDLIDEPTESVFENYMNEMGKFR